MSTTEAPQATGQRISASSVMASKTEKTVSAVKPATRSNLAGAAPAPQDCQGSQDNHAREPIGALSEVMAQLSHAGPGVARVLAMLHLAMSGSLNENDCNAAVHAVIAQAAGNPYFDLADYMGRTWLVEPEPWRAYNARVHKIMRSDHDRCLHDHPWNNASIVLKGGYWEILPGPFQAAMEWLHAPSELQGGAVVPASAAPAEIREAQRLNDLIQRLAADQLLAADLKALQKMSVYWRAPLSFTPRLAGAAHRLVIPQGQTAWSLFVMRPKQCDWGFITPHGWVHNEPYLEAFGREA